MKTKQTILKAFASVALAMGAFASADAQSNLGAACGCPTVAARSTTQNTIPMSSLPGYQAVNGTGGGILQNGATLTCDKLYILDVKIYIPEGKSLNIAPGTLIKGNPVTNPAAASALVISRGGKINAAGTESCPIVFTALDDPMDGTYPLSNTGKWGGVVLLGKAPNNLTLAANGPFVPGGAGKLAVADGMGTVEGFASSYPLDQYGVATSIPQAYPAGTSPVSSTYTMTWPAAASGTGASTVNNAGQSTITLANTTNNVYILVGQVVSGTGISQAPAAVTTVTNVNGAVITLSTATIADLAGGTITFTGTYPQAPNTAGNYFAGSTGTGILSSGNPLTFGPVVSGVNYAAPFIGSLSAAGALPDENDNSGVMKYVSIRHSGAILSVGAEINGLTLASVGRGTTIDHIEIVSCADDNIELFGGTVNLKYITTIFGNDDMFDYDLGWKGKAQFFFGMKNTSSGASIDNDNGIEADSHDNTSMTAFRSHPVLYNFTILGNGKTTTTADNRGLAGVNFKDGAEGELYNSIIANFKNGINLAKALPTSGSPAVPISGAYNSWNNWRVGTDNTGGAHTPAANFTAASLKIKCNTILMNSGTLNSNGLGIDASTNIGSTGAIAAAASTGAGSEMEQFEADGNTVSTAALPGFSYAFTVSPTNVVSVKNDVTPTTPLSIAGCPTPLDGFFEFANYRGAFSSTLGENWLSNWSYSQILNSTSGVRACPTDFDLDGDTDVDDFGVFAPAFGIPCN